MSPYTRIIVTWLVFGALLWASPSLAQPDRGNLVPSSLEINQKLMTSAQAKDLDKIEQLLPIIKPLTDAHKVQFGIDMESELNPRSEPRTTTGCSGPHNNWSFWI
jgi:hypothetical protein